MTHLKSAIYAEKFERFNVPAGNNRDIHRKEDELVSYSTNKYVCPEF
jgi:hypothetical protein